MHGGPHALDFEGPVFFLDSCVAHCAVEQRKLSLGRSALLHHWSDRNRDALLDRLLGQAIEHDYGFRGQSSDIRAAAPMNLLIHIVFERAVDVNFKVSLRPSKAPVSCNVAIA